MLKKTKKRPSLSPAPKRVQQMPIENRRDELANLASTFRSWSWDDTSQAQSSGFRQAALHCDQAITLISLIIESTESELNRTLTSPPKVPKPRTKRAPSK